VSNTLNETDEPKNIKNASKIHTEVPHQKLLFLLHIRDLDNETFSLAFPCMAKVNSAVENTSALQHHMLVPAPLKLLVLRGFSCWKRKVHWNQGE
jgi:hypothetical protein